MSVTSLRNGLRWLANPYAFLNDAQAAHGLTFRVDLPVLGRVLMTGDPEMIQDIVRNRDLDGGKGIAALRSILGDRSLIMLHGEEHQARRRLIAPRFRGQRSAGFDDLTVATTLDEIQQVPTNRPFSMYHLLLQISLRTIVRAIFGHQPPSEEKHSISLVENFLHSFKNPLFLFLKPLQIDWGRFSPWGRALRHRQQLVAYILRQIKSARAVSNEESSILAEVVGESHTNGAISDNEIACEILALLLFGHDTGAATMAWAFAHIYQHPGAIDRIRKEAVECRDTNEKINPGKHDYLAACINESMRLCPVVVHLTRVAAQDTTVGAYPIKRGEKVLPCLYLAQHNPAVFPEPEKFRPERFMNGEGYDLSFFPFGVGNRTCIGRPFVLQQMVLILSTLISHSDLMLASGYEAQPTRRLVLIVPQDGTTMLKTR
jgi:cytochrome P450